MATIFNASVNKKRKIAKIEKKRDIKKAGQKILSFLCEFLQVLRGENKCKKLNENKYKKLNKNKCKKHIFLTNIFS